MLLYRLASNLLCKYGCSVSVYPLQLRQVIVKVGVSGSRVKNNSNIIISCGRTRPRRISSSSNGATIGLLTTTATAAAIILLSVVARTNAIEFQYSQQQQQQQPETLLDIPQMLSGDECSSSSSSSSSPQQDCKKKARIQRPKSRKAESCTIKCVTTCIRGGSGSPGEGPLNVRRPLVVFKQGFRTRQYCLVECSDICNLIGDGDDGP